MPGKTDSIYWDTCIFYALLKGEEHRPGELAEIKRQQRLFDNGVLDICTSTITIVEICEGKLSDQQKDTLTGIFKRSNFVWVELNNNVAELATKLRTQFASFKEDGSFELVWTPPDAIQIASAIAIECETLITFDTDNKPKQKALSVTAFADEIKAEHGLTIMRPDTRGQTELNYEQER